MIPVFPLNAVLFPGLVTPLHIFEDRYRAMMRDLLALETPADRVFSVVAIREGYEVGAHGVHSAHRVGTLVQLTDAVENPDGTYDIAVTGRQRLRVGGLDTSHAYVRAEVQLFTDDESGSAEEAAATLAVFERYRAELSDVRGGPVLTGDLPRDPAYLSYALAATCLLTVSQRQRLLEAPDAGTRLRMIRHELSEERRAMRAWPSLPATEVARTRWSPN